MARCLRKDARNNGARSQPKSIQNQLDKRGLREQEQVMQIATCWMREGITQGLEQGLQQEIALVLRQLNRKNA